MIINICQLKIKSILTRNKKQQKCECTPAHTHEGGKLETIIDKTCNEIMDFPISYTSKMVGTLVKKVARHNLYYQELMIGEPLLLLTLDITLVYMVFQGLCLSIFAQVSDQTCP